MDRPIVGFHLDEFDDWVAELRCGHGQHVRHKPPFWVREWVLTEEGRASRLGVQLGCVRCDRFELPDGHVPYKRTPEFVTSTIPNALLNQHSTKPGVWGVINVLAGQLRYVVESPLAREQWLTTELRGIVVPEVLHRVEPDGDVTFFVEFYRAATA